jgi:HAE1 family hydrophobic/amphiphilic exporter-1
MGMITAINKFLLASGPRAAVASAAIIAAAAVATWMLMPKVEYLPEGNRNLVFGILLPPPGYNIDELLRMGDLVEERLIPYWDVDPGTTIRAQSSVHSRALTMPPSGIRAIWLAKSMSGQPPTAFSS